MPYRAKLLATRLLPDRENPDRKKDGRSQLSRSLNCVRNRSARIAATCLYFPLLIDLLNFPASDRGIDIIPSYQCAQRAFRAPSPRTHGGHLLRGRYEKFQSALPGPMRRRVPAIAAGRGASRAFWHKCGGAAIFVCRSVTAVECGRRGRRLTPVPPSVRPSGGDVPGGPGRGRPG